MRKAFVLDEMTRLDVSDARRYGEIVYIFRESDNIPSLWSSSYVIKAVERLKEEGFSPESDFIVVSGNIAGLTLFLTSLARMTESSLNLLLYDASLEEYTHKVIL